MISATPLVVPPPTPHGHYKALALTAPRFVELAMISIVLK